MYGHRQVSVEAYPLPGIPPGILSICKNTEVAAVYERKTKKLQVVISNTLNLFDTSMR